MYRTLHCVRFNWNKIWKAEFLSEQINHTVIFSQKPWDYARRLRLIKFQPNFGPVLIPGPKLLRMNDFIISFKCLLPCKSKSAVFNCWQYRWRLIRAAGVYIMQNTNSRIFVFFNDLFSFKRAQRLLSYHLIQRPCLSEIMGLQIISLLCSKAGSLIYCLRSYVGPSLTIISLSSNPIMKLSIGNSIKFRMVINSYLHVFSFTIFF